MAPLFKASGYAPALQVTGFEATRAGDAERGPQIRLRADEARLRMLVDGELAWIYGPRRHELAQVKVDESVARGCVLVRDVAGIAPSEIVRVYKIDADRPRGGAVG